jgi:hypothetical protein
VASREGEFRKKRYLVLDERYKKHNYIAKYAERTRNKEEPERLKKQWKMKTKHYSNVRSFFLNILMTERENNFVNAPEALLQIDIF